MREVARTAKYPGVTMVDALILQPHSDHLSTEMSPSDGTTLAGQQFIFIAIS